jgi:acyl carrier protein
MHDYEATKARLCLVFQDVFEDDTIEIFDHTTANDIDEWDSIFHISLILAAESEFDVRLSAAEIGSLEKVGELIKILQNKAP